MNHMGWILVWLTLQVSLLLVPALVIQARAGRPGSVGRTSVAAWSLGLVLILDVAAFLPGIGSVAPSALLTTSAIPSPGGLAVGVIAEVDARPAGGRLMMDWRAVWDRLGRQAVGPVERVRPWGSWIAVGVLAGMTCGLIRLCGGLWAIRICRRRGWLVVDAGLMGLVEELRGAMGCRRVVEVRAVVDLATPATAGWRRPLLLLPADWRRWNEAERRAVLAHELAHILQGDYATSLLARVVMVLNAPNPLVRWMAGRLHLEQELAADALGARFAGGPAAYVVALSSLALKQDDRRSLSWPARAFLPTRGTLIRRIAMLRNESRSSAFLRTRSVRIRSLAVLALAALTLGLATLKSPVRADDDPATVETTSDRKVAPFSDTVYVPDSASVVIALRPAAAFRQPRMDGLLTMIRAAIAEDIGWIAKEIQVDLKRPDFLAVEPDQIESIVTSINIVSNGRPGQPPKLHRVRTVGQAVRMVTPFDWLALLRQWRVGIEEFHVGERVYCKLSVPQPLPASSICCIYLPDDRTIVVLDSQSSMEELLGRPVPTEPAFLRGPDWEQAEPGLVTLAIDNRGDRFVKQYDVGRADDAVVLRCFQGVDRVVIGVADSPNLTLTGMVTARDPGAAGAVVQTITGLIQLGRAALAGAPPAGVANPLAIRLGLAILTKVQVRADGSIVALSVTGFGTLDEAVALIRAQVNPPKSVEPLPKPR